MQPTGTLLYDKPVGDALMRILSHVGPTSYVNGTGFQISANDAGLNVAEVIVLLSTNSLTWDFVYDPTTGFVKALVRTTGLEVANAVDLSGAALYFLVRGKD